MIKIFRKYTILFYFPLLLLPLLFLPTSCQRNEALAISRAEPLSILKRIKDRGQIIAFAEYGPASFYIDHGSPQGYSYEVLKDYADHLGVELKMVESPSVPGSFSALKSGIVDILAINLTADPGQMNDIRYTEPIAKSQVVLVQKNVNTGKGRAAGRNSKSMIRDQKDLDGKEVYLPYGSPLAKIFTLPEGQHKSSIRIHEIKNKESEQIMAEVAAGTIPYTLAYRPVAESFYLKQAAVDIRTKVGREQEIVWAVSNASDDLLRDFNKWYKKYRKTFRRAALYQRYFNQSNATGLVENDANLLREGKISPYDEYIKKYSKSIGWDWRLVASIIYNESKFRTDVKARTGAFGLMQFMPRTGKLYNVDESSTPEQQIEAGVKCIAELEKQFKKQVKNQTERQNFVLAAYNIGLAHIIDARRLAEKYGKDKNIWKGHVDTFLLKKADPKYYKDPVVEHGSCKGTETYNFVNNVRARYELYRNAVQ